MGAVAVAKRSRAKASDNDLVPPANDPDPGARTASTMIRSTDAWKATLEELAEYDRIGSTAELIDRAIVAYARLVGFPKPFPKR